MENLKKEKFRPQLHFSTREKWMNDPNGLLFHNGIYHLYFQHYPKDTKWGPMHWGHATSKDLIHWEHQKIALFPDDLGYIFSGSTIVDKNNISGFKSNENDPIIAFFTHHDPKTELQTQSIAYSVDNGLTFTKYEFNPIISNPGIKDFRDPKVFWHEESKKWIMLIVGGDHMLIFNSENLIKWELKSTFGKENGSHDGVWECPDLFPLKVENENIIKWVLLISINPGGINGGSATQYFIGDFDGNSFISNQKEIKWIDYGKDNYAGITFNNLPLSERIFMGWMSNWQYANEVPTEKWRNCLTIPRKLSLKKYNNSYILIQKPIENFSNLFQKKNEKKLNKNTNNFIEKLDTEFCKISFNLKHNNNKNLSLKIRNEINEYIEFKINLTEKKIEFSREKSGQINFKKEFAEKNQIGELFNIFDEIKFTIILDNSSIELFINDGETTFTNLFFPTKPYNKICIKSENNFEIKNYEINYLKSIW